jgi:hypothetical protein
MTPGKLNFTCPQGSTFDRQLTWKIDNNPVHLQGYNGRLQVREYHYSDDFIVNLNSISSSGGISLGGSAGTINVYIDPETTSQFSPGSYVYDLEMYTSTNVYRLVEGKFIVTPEVTR